MTLFFRRPEGTVFRAGVEHHPEAMGYPTAARVAQAQGSDGVHSANWGKPRGGGRAGGRLKPVIKVTIRGDRPPRLGGDVVTFEAMREFLVTYSEHEQQMHITNQDGGNRVPARRRQLIDSATQMMVADEFYDGKPWVGPSEEEIMQGLKAFLALICGKRVMRIFAARYSVC